MHIPKKIEYGSIAVITALIAWFIVRSEAPPPVDAAWEAELQARSATMNANLPAPIDEETMLVTTAAQGNTLEFRHTWVNLQAEDVHVGTTTSKLYQLLRTGACSSAEFAMYRAHGTLLQYVYYDMDGDFVLGIKVDTRTCPQ
jgi:hypothetical protein